MPMIEYTPKAFSDNSLAVIAQADAICSEYRRQGFDLTLRQLYYQFVARGFIPNRDTEYKRLGSIVNDARLAGMLDWDYIVDRTRNLRALSHWDSPADIIATTARAYNVDHWAGQPDRAEVWIEKDALVGVIEGVCSRNDVPFFSCRGYTSQSELWGAAQRIGGYLDGGAERVTVIHLGDHDPSGIDMTRDIQARLDLFLSGDGYDPDQVTVQRIALNMDQVRRFSPPPNPAKLTDSRVGPYIARFGGQSWELDALDPRTLDGLIQDTIDAHRDPDLWAATTAEQADARKGLDAAAKRWAEVRDFLA